ncbi:MAG TPA: tRNA lysidine(34) synthetase TilS [Drouetiella sp.]
MQNLFLAKILASLTSHESLVDVRDSAVLAAISGGPDSTALLLALRVLQEDLKIAVGAVHVNHKMRGEESDGDEEYCRALCKRLSVPLYVHTAKKTSRSSEESMRRVRYDFLCSQAKAKGAKAVFLAHTSSDQVETVLFRILRGTSPAGLIGMSPAYTLKDGTNLVRPMLDCSRDDVMDFLKECATEARFDSSNDDVSYTRNFLRNSLVPLAKTRFHSLERQVEKLRVMAKSDESFMDLCVSHAINDIGGTLSNRWKIERIADLHESLSRRIIARALKERGIETEYERVFVILNMMADSNTRQRISLNEHWDLAVERGELIWIKMPEEIESHGEHTYSVHSPGTTVLTALDKTLGVHLCEEAPAINAVNRESLDILVDLSRVKSALTVRRGVSRDQIQPLGMSQMVRLKKYLHSNNKRSRALGPYVLASEDEILWVPGLGFSDKIKVIDKPTHRLSIGSIAADISIC